MLGIGWVSPYLWSGSNNRHCDLGGRWNFHCIRLCHHTRSPPPRLLPHTRTSERSDRCTTLHQTGGKQINNQRGLGEKGSQKRWSLSIHLVFFAVLVHAATLLDGYADHELLHKPIVAHTSWFTSLILVAAWGTIQVPARGTAGRDARGVMAVCWTPWR